MIYLGLGTNLGDRRANLSRARELLEDGLEVQLIASYELETEAIGFDGGDFINQVVAFEKPDGLEPEDLLDICQEIELEMGRKKHCPRYKEDGTRLYEDRIIDIDILFFDDVKMCTERLIIPHPQVHERLFVTTLLQNVNEKL